MRGHCDLGLTYVGLRVLQEGVCRYGKNVEFVPQEIRDGKGEVRCGGKG